LAIFSFQGMRREWLLKTENCTPQTSMHLYRLSDSLIAVTGGRAVRLPGLTLDALFTAEDPAALAAAAVESGEPCALPDTAQPIAAPVQSQEVWAAGVTYFRSRVARMEESEEAGASRFYDMVYNADRPELFFKATAARTRGHRQPVRIRSDASWNVPEPELVLAINAAGRVFGYTIGNDMSSRDIEGENLLYLPQAKVYLGSCAVGPCLTICPPPGADTGIHLTIRRDGAVAFEGSTSLAQLKRQPQELADWLFRENEFPAGALLFTGTGLVPPGQWSLTAMSSPFA
jgi:2-dehydro-3-deoxy-D-arabinonate dehydratase